LIQFSPILLVCLEIIPGFSSFYYFAFLVLDENDESLP